MTVDVAVVLLNRDPRVADHPALAPAVAMARRVVPLFVLDPERQARRFDPDGAYVDRWLGALG